jgi:hypothetical protein
MGCFISSKVEHKWVSLKAIIKTLLFISEILNGKTQRGKISGMSSII